MSRQARLAAIILAGAALLAGCAGPRESVVLLPSPSGLKTAVSVTQDSRELLLDQPYAAARLSRGGVEAYPSNAADVQARYGAALAAQPVPPAQFTLFFIEGRDEFTDESKKIVDSVFAEIARRPIPDVIVIGHTDTVGDDAANDALSLLRADVVRKALVARGLAPDQVVVIGRGKRDLSVLTANGVSEAANRRVEILVR